MIGQVVTFFFCSIDTSYDFLRPFGKDLTCVCSKAQNPPTHGTPLTQRVLLLLRQDQGVIHQILHIQLGQKKTGDPTYPSFSSLSQGYNPQMSTSSSLVGHLTRCSQSHLQWDGGRHIPIGIGRLQQIVFSMTHQIKHKGDCRIPPRQPQTIKSLPEHGPWTGASKIDFPESADPTLYEISGYEFWISKGFQESSSSMNSSPFTANITCYDASRYALQKSFWSTWNRVRLGWKKARNRSRHLSPRPHRFLLAKHRNSYPLMSIQRQVKGSEDGNQNISTGFQTNLWRQPVLLWWMAESEWIWFTSTFFPSLQPKTPSEVGWKWSSLNVESNSDVLHSGNKCQVKVCSEDPLALVLEDAINTYARPHFMPLATLPVSCQQHLTARKF